MDAKTKMVKDKLTDEMKRAQATLDKWVEEKLVKNPAWAFEWAEGAMGAAATLAVVPRMIELLDNYGLESLYEECVAYAVRAAARNYRGSRCSDLMEHLQGQAWGETAEYLRLYCCTK